VDIAIVDSLDAATQVCSISVPVSPLNVTLHALYAFSVYLLICCSVHTRDVVVLLLLVLVLSSFSSLLLIVLCRHSLPSVYRCQRGRSVEMGVEFQVVQHLPNIHKSRLT